MNGRSEPVITWQTKTDLITNLPSLNFTLRTIFHYLLCVNKSGFLFLVFEGHYMTYHCLKRYINLFIENSRISEKNHQNFQEIQFNNSKIQHYGVNFK